MVGFMFVIQAAVDASCKPVNFLPSSWMNTDEANVEWVIKADDAMLRAN
jgi:hypothetical protein